ncbi:unnamed protein product [Anisakis simplex]|uniref:SH3 domain-binding protein 5-like (inferred by orthology to a human protein) n=1 Tax=Anisakis simplex TaxID=6269 RepID=A0A0M3K6I2_ANISI|nr:unnamed protein product [Anisakis simplex]
MILFIRIETLNEFSNNGLSHYCIADDESGIDVDDVNFVIDQEIPLDAKHLNRVHEELEKLNIATDVINKLELQLDEARANFGQIQANWSQKLNDLSKKYGSAIEKARPYYEAKLEERKLREEAQKAAIRFERANSMHAVAKQQVKLTQDSLNRQKCIEPECLEVLNHHIQRVNETESERQQAEEMHRNLSAQMANTAMKVISLHKQNARAIKKSRHYFDQRIEFTRVLEQQKDLIVKLEIEVRQKKFDYTTSLRNLEQISDSIHEQRSLSSMKRETGVGCEYPETFASEQQSSESQKRKNEKEHEESRKKADQDNQEALKGIRSKLDQMTMNYDKSIDDALIFVDDQDDQYQNSSKNVSLGSGVILLAQQLIRPHDKSHQKSSTSIVLSRDDSAASDFRYQTALPKGVTMGGSDDVQQNINNSFETSDSECSNESSTHNDSVIGTEELCGMLRSHTILMKEIKECTDRTGNILQSGVSDVERSSASGDSNAGY